MGEARRRKLLGYDPRIESRPVGELIAEAERLNMHELAAMLRESESRRAASAELMHRLRLEFPDATPSPEQKQ